MVGYTGRVVDLIVQSVYLETEPQPEAPRSYRIAGFGGDIL